MSFAFDWQNVESMRATPGKRDEWDGFLSEYVLDLQREALQGKLLQEKFPQVSFVIPTDDSRYPDVLRVDGLQEDEDDA